MAESMRPRSLLSRVGLLAGILAAAAPQGPVAVVGMRGHKTIHWTRRAGQSRYTKAKVDRTKRNARNRMARKSRRINMANGSYRRATR